MTCVVLAAVLAVAPAGQAPSTPQPETKLVRVFIHTADGGEPSELAARLESVKHLSEALGKKKTLAMASDEDRADVVIGVRGRGLVVPKVVIGMAPRPGDPPKRNTRRAIGSHAGHP